MLRSYAELSKIRISFFAALSASACFVLASGVFTLQCVLVTAGVFFSCFRFLCVEPLSGKGHGPAHAEDLGAAYTLRQDKTRSGVGLFFFINVHWKRCTPCMQRFRSLALRDVCGTLV